MFLCASTIANAANFRANAARLLFWRKKKEDRLLLLLILLAGGSAGRGQTLLAKP